MGKSVVVSRGLDNCLFVFTIKEWGSIAEKLANNSMLQSDARSFNRYMLGSATEVAVDAQGRMLLPEFLKEAVGITSKVAVVGMYSRVELWEESTWKKHKQTVEKNAEGLAEKLGSIGVL